MRQSNYSCLSLFLSDLSQSRERNQIIGSELEYKWGQDLTLVFDTDDTA